MKQKWIQLLVAAGVSLAAIGGLFLAKDSVVIYLGIRAFRMLQVGLIAAGAAVTGGTLISSVVTYNKIQDQLEVTKREQIEMQEIHRRQTAGLSVQDKLDNSTLRKFMVQKGQGDWSMLGELIGECNTQMVSMDEYQNRLSKLLSANGADTLYDTEDVLDQAEQGMCRNVRKVINYMEVSDGRLPEDVEMIRSKLEICIGQNKEILKQSQEFVFALAEFLNRQGDSDQDVSMLEIYKKTILDAIEEEPK